MKQQARPGRKNPQQQSRPNTHVHIKIQGVMEMGDRINEMVKDLHTASEMATKITSDNIIKNMAALIERNAREMRPLPTDFTRNRPFEDIIDRGWNYF